MEKEKALCTGIQTRHLREESFFVVAVAQLTSSKVPQANSGKSICDKQKERNILPD